MTVAREDPDSCSHCAGSNITQDPDVLDTWFSSGLWPFSTMGWPGESRDLKTFYPTALLNTGFDILFFWVARMIMLGIEMTGEVPFRQVYIHGLVRDADKQKMSKTKGNVIDPIEVTEKYGTDAVRFALVAAAGQGSDVVLSEERIGGARTFANKIWNAARFVFMSLERSGAESWTPDNPDAYRPQAIGTPAAVPLEDRWIFSRLNAVARQVSEHLERFRYHDAANVLYHFFWGEFCDWYIELKKLSFEDDSGLTPQWRNMLAALERALRLLHPVMPFITEELWQRVTSNQASRPKSVALAAYPAYREDLADPEAERQMAVLQEVISAVRKLRVEMSVAPKTRLDATLYAHDHDAAAVVTAQAEALRRLANVNMKIEPGAMHGACTATLTGARPCITAATSTSCCTCRRLKLRSCEAVLSNSSSHLKKRAMVLGASLPTKSSSRKRHLMWSSRSERNSPTTNPRSNACKQRSIACEGFAPGGGKAVVSRGAAGDPRGGAILARISHHLAKRSAREARHYFVALARRAQRTVKYACARQAARASY